MVSLLCGVLLCADVQSREWYDDERLFPLKLFALCPKATEFDRGGVRSSVGQNELGALGMGQLQQYERVSSQLQQIQHESTVVFFFLYLSAQLPCLVCFFLIQEKYFLFKTMCMLDVLFNQSSIFVAMGQCVTVYSRRHTGALTCEPPQHTHPALLVESKCRFLSSLNKFYKQCCLAVVI